MSKDILEKLKDAARGEYVCDNPVTVSEDCLRLIAETNYRRGQEHERERCAKIAESVGPAWEHCGSQIAATIRDEDIPAVTVQ